MNKKTSFLLLILFTTLTHNSSAAEGPSKPKTSAESIAKIRSAGCVGCKKKETKEELLKVCARCKVTPYCSKKCQKTHWQNGHKDSCYKLGIIFKTIDPKKDPKTLVFTLP
jgi:hypothetical protein